MFQNNIHLIRVKTVEVMIKRLKGVRVLPSTLHIYFFLLEKARNPMAFKILKS